MGQRISWLTVQECQLDVFPLVLITLPYDATVRWNYYFTIIIIISNLSVILAPVNCDEGAIRLADGDIQQQGRVEICIDGIWSTICATNWDNSNAFVVCKQLGFAASGELHPIPLYHRLCHRFFFIPSHSINGFCW